MLKLKKNVLLLLLILLGLFAQLYAKKSYETNQDQLEDDEDDEEDYSWDYDDDSEEKPKVSKHILVSLTRDWLGRENPDAYPTHGFFPVWAFALLIIAAFFLLLAIVSGMLHILGCRGKRPVEKGEKRLSVPLIEIPKKHSRAGAHHAEPNYAGSAQDITAHGHGQRKNSHTHLHN